jgi:pimeloyl-ACP methyl ester carboxylesterase
MKLRLYHHPDGARVAYRETGTGPGLAILHSATLSHREWAPVVDDLALRYRVVLPDLPLHGDSEDRPRHPYTLEWMGEVMAGFVRDTCGPRPLVAGHELGAELQRHGQVRLVARQDAAADSVARLEQAHAAAAARKLRCSG